MKVTKSKKNDRAAFFNLPPEKYKEMPKIERRKWIKKEEYIGTLEEVLAHQRP